MSLLRKLLVQNGGGKDYILFEDPVVAKICAETWGDGTGLTYAQAKKVTSIPDWKSWSGITSFNELRYFENLASIGQGGFRNTGVSIDDVVLPNLASLGGHTFESTSIKRVSNLGRLSSITTWDYSYTFNNCSLLEYIKLPDTLTEIKSRMIISCSSLKTVDIGNAVGTIAEWFLGWCDSLENIIIRTAQPPVVSSTSYFMYNVPATCRIYVPDDSVDSYKATDTWSEKADQIKPLSEYDS